MRNKNRVCSALLLLIALYPATFAFAETILLKSGEKIIGTVIEKNAKYLKVDFKGAVIIYRVYEIESIDGQPLAGDINAGTEKPLKYLLESKGVSTVPAVTDAVTPAEYLQRGVTYYNKGNFEQAIADFGRAIKEKADYGAAFLYRGLAYISKNNIDEAIADYSRAIELEPKNEEAYYVRGLAYAGKKDIDLALADYSKAIEINPKYVQAYLNRGFINNIKGNGEQVLSDVSKILEINPGVAMAYFLRGLVYANAQNMEQCVSDYTKAIELKPDYSEAYINRALAYAYRDKIVQARASPSSPNAYVNTAVAAEVNKADLDLAIADCNKAIEFNPNFLEAYMVRARIRLLGKDYDKAREDLNKIKELGGEVKPELFEELKNISEGKEKKEPLSAQEQAVPVNTQASE